MINGEDIWIQTIKDKKGKYGRYLAEIWLKDGKDQWININDLMVDKGFTEYKEY